MEQPTKEQIVSELQLIYDSWIVRYGLPADAQVVGMRNEMNAYFDSINLTLVIGQCNDISTLVNVLNVIGLTDVDRA